MAGYSYINAVSRIVAPVAAVVVAIIAYLYLSKRSVSTTSNSGNSGNNCNDVLQEIRLQGQQQQTKYNQILSRQDVTQFTVGAVERISRENQNLIRENARMIKAFSPFD